MSNTRIAEGFVTLILAAVLASLHGCAGPAKPEAKAGTYEGPPTTIGGGQARMFVTLDSEGKPTTIGVRMNDAALTGLPTTHPYDTAGVEYRVDLPKEAAMTGYDHFTVNWNPMGHIPPGVYDSPHFDFHFYLLSPTERYRISLEGEDRARAQKQPSPKFMPEGYILPEGTAEPRMGAHAIDPSGPEFNHQPFTKTFIYGFYDGRMIFVEPMITKAFLETKTTLTDNVKLPQSYQVHAYYPTKYRVGYDPVRKEHVVALEGLVYR